MFRATGDSIKFILIITMFFIVNTAQAQSWGDVAFSGTLNANELCYTDGADIVCDADLLVNGAAALDVSGTVSATAFVGDGASLTNVAGLWGYDADGGVYRTDTVAIGTSYIPAGAPELRVQNNAGAQIFISGGGIHELTFGHHANMSNGGSGMLADADDLKLFTYSSTRDITGVMMTLKGNTGVGIYNETPAYELDVSGTVQATSFIGDGASLTNVVVVMGVNDLTDAIHDTDDYSSLFIGNGAGANDDGTTNSNTGVGLDALTTISTNAGNTAFGNSSLKVVTGANNTGVGTDAGNGITWGSGNTAIGANALSSGAGDNNIAVGFAALSSASGYNNVAVGANSMASTTSGGSNIAMGRGSLQTNTTGKSNAALGYYAQTLSTGHYNVSLGHNANNALTTGSNNIAIGSSVTVPSNTGDDQLNIGDTLYGDLGNDYVGIGLTSPTVALDVSGSIQYTGTITDLSDKRLKQNIETLPTGQLENIAKVNAVSFAMKDNPNVTEYGVIAQELEKVFPALVHTADDVSGTKSVNYVGLIAPLIKAVQEQQTQIEVLKQEIEALKNK